MSLLLDLLYPRNYHQPDFNQIKTKSVFQIDGFEGVLPIFAYNYPIKDMLQDLKYNFITDLIDDIVNQASTTLFTDFPNLLDYWQQQQFILIPVPLHYYRQNWRGFNQSELLAVSLSKLIHLPVYSHIVSRHRFTIPQASLTDKLLRRSNLSDSFILNQSPPQNIILFDDVITTGSTLKSLASIFPKSTNLWGLSIAG